MKPIQKLAVVSLALVGTVSAADSFDRTVLPVQMPHRPLYSEVDVRNVKLPPRHEVTAPTGAPDVIQVTETIAIAVTKS